MDDPAPRLDFDGARQRRLLVEEAEAGGRLDAYLAARLEGFSRALVQRLIRSGHVRLNGAPTRPATRLKPGEEILVEEPEILPPRIDPEDLPLEVVLEEESFVVFDKPPGMAVHPGHGRPKGTLANAVVQRYGSLGLGGEAHRPGIVHRLDLDTSGVIVVALDAAAHAALSAAFKQRRVEKVYRALVSGEPDRDEEIIDLPLGRDALHPTRRAVRFDGGRPAWTRSVVLERFGVAAHLECRPRTGRTHQIRVHLQSRGHPILGDATYGRGRAQPLEVPRLMLHAFRIVFPHPRTGAPVTAEAQLPADFEAALEALRAIDARGGGG